MKLPVDEELRKWAEKNVHSDAENTDFLGEFLKHGDLDKKDQVFFAMIILLAGRIDQDFRRIKFMLFTIFLLCLAIVIIIS